MQGQKQAGGFFCMRTYARVRKSFVSCNLALVCPVCVYCEHVQPENEVMVMLFRETLDWRGTKHDVTVKRKHNFKGDLIFRFFLFSNCNTSNLYSAQVAFQERRNASLNS